MMFWSCFYSWWSRQLISLRVMMKSVDCIKILDENLKLLALNPHPENYIYHIFQYRFRIMFWQIAKENGYIMF